jgi:pimeloyl-ACP methyl ester carboxylesterase
LNFRAVTNSNWFAKPQGAQQMNDSTQRQLEELAATSSGAVSGVWRRNALLLTVGASLAAAALVTRRRTRQAERENPPVGRFVYVDGVRLHYVERGTGQPLVLLHGNGSMIQDFETSGLIDMAAKNYRVIVFDRPGFGYSDRPRSTVWTPQAQAELLHHALRLLDVEQPVVVGHSWGTLVAVALALEFPHYVKSLVLLSGYYYPTPRVGVMPLSIPAIPVIGDLLRYTVSPLLSRLLWPVIRRQIFGPAPVPAHFSGFPVWMALRPSQLRASAAETALMIPAAFALRHRYHELTMPMVIMAGTDDRLINANKQSAHLHHDVPDSRLHLTPGAGHMVHQLAPDDVMAAIDEAARATEPPQTQALARRHVFPAPRQIN